MARAFLPALIAARWGYRALPVLMVFMAAFAADATEWRVERGQDGVARLLKDGAPIEPWVFCFARVTPGRDLEYKSVTEEIRLAKKSGTRIYSVSMEPDWGDAKSPNNEYADHVMRTVLSVDPDAFVLPRIQMANPPWLEGNLVERNLSSQGSRDLASVCSARYRADCAKAVRGFVRRMEAKWGDHMFGYQVAGGHHGEFQFLNFGRQGNYLGYDEGTRRAFKAKTGLDVPSVIRRSGEVGRAFYDPVRDADIVAFNRFLGEEMADHLLEMAREVRAECGRTRVTAAFYGYVFECYAQRVGPSQSGHFALSKVLDSPDIDILCGPYSYSSDSRCPGCPATTHTVGESIAAHGKIWMNEDDTATHISMARREPEDGTTRSGWNRSLDETTMLVRRNFAFSLARNYGSWWFDHHSHGMWNDPALWDERARFARLWKALPQTPYRGDVRYVFSERATDYCIANVPVHWVLQEGAYFGRTLVARCGCTTETVLLEDILEVAVGRDPPKLEIHANSVALTKPQRLALRRRAEKIPTIWLWVPGLIDIDAGKESLAAVEELTGFKVRAVSPPTFAVYAKPDGLDFNLPITWGYGKTQGTVLSPVMEDGDKLLAVWRDDTWRPAAVLRPAKNGKAFSVFCAAPSMPSAGIRAFARMAGANMRCSRDASVDVRKGMAAITVGEGGAYDFAPGEGEWFDFATGRSVGAGPRVVLDLPPQSTTVLIDAATMERYKKEAAK